MKVIGGCELRDASRRSILFAQSKRKIYLYTDSGEILSINLTTGTVHEMQTYKNSIKIDGHRISLNRIVSLVFLGFIANDGEISIKKLNGKSSDFRKRNIALIIRSGANVEAVLQGRRFTTYLRLHDEREDDTSVL